MKKPANHPVIKIAFTLMMLCLAPAAALAEGSKVVASQQPLKIEEALHSLRLTGRAPIALSPDGQLVAYALADGTKRASTGDTRHSDFSRTGVYVEAIGCDIWIADTQTGHCENLTGGKGASWAPVWSPDGKNLAFYSDRSGIANLWVWDRATKQLRQLSNAIVRPF